jgi:hypothetical protein
MPKRVAMGVCLVGLLATALVMWNAKALTALPA